MHEIPLMKTPKLKLFASSSSLSFFNIKTCAIISWDLVKFQTCETTSIDGIVFFFKISILWLSRGLFFKEIFLTIYLWDYLTWKIKSFEYFSIYFDFYHSYFDIVVHPFFNEFLLIFFNHFVSHFTFNLTKIYYYFLLSNSQHRK